MLTGALSAMQTPEWVNADEMKVLPSRDKQRRKISMPRVKLTSFKLL
jgi:hypothetical protein